ncbi:MULTISPECIES: hypothetical protein [unclassified Sutcliffiella]|uniref:hypothetical protein n=1 Tax=unclassified Sutcliffiella TaxID=2837532 RepID=UPI0030CDC3E7
MAPILNWKKEVTYSFRFLETEHKEYIYVNGIDAKRYRLADDNPAFGMNPTSHPSTGEEHEVIEAELVGEYLRRVTPTLKRYELVYSLPDIDKYVFLNYEEEISDYPGESGSRFYFLSVPF